MSKIVQFIKDWPQKRKALVPIAAAIVFGVSQYFGADSVIAGEVVLVLTAAGVYQVPNAKKAAPVVPVVVAPAATTTDAPPVP